MTKSNKKEKERERGEKKENSKDGKERKTETAKETNMKIIDWRWGRDFTFINFISLTRMFSQTIKQQKFVKYKIIT